MQLHRNLIWSGRDLGVLKEITAAVAPHCSIIQSIDSILIPDSLSSNQTALVITNNQTSAPKHCGFKETSIRIDFNHPLLRCLSAFFFLCCVFFPFSRPAQAKSMVVCITHRTEFSDRLHSPCFCVSLYPGNPAAA